MYSSVALNIFTLLCNHHYHPCLELFHLPQLKLCINTYFLSFLATIILFSVLVNLTTLGTSYKWNHTIFVLLWLAKLALLGLLCTISILKGQPSFTEMFTFSSDNIYLVKPWKIAETLFCISLGIWAWEKIFKPSVGSICQTPLYQRESKVCQVLCFSQHFLSK